ncbi:MAG TPA: hypothetical protein VMW72_13415 [Sedimentisphaerales bacterium]|nr:hypothetical protein [Sedimentisphaerales bacterium]
MIKSNMLLSILLLCLILSESTFSKEQNVTEPNKPDYLKEIPPDKLKEDLDLLFKTIEEVHPNMYAYTSKEEFDPLSEKLYESIDHPMNRLEFYKLVAPVVAKLKSGHTLITPWQLFQEYLQNGGKVFPIELHWDGECVVLNDAYTPIALPLGGTILEINGGNAPKVIRRISR